MSDERPTYYELVKTNWHLANAIVNIGKRFEEQLQERMAEAWDAGHFNGRSDQKAREVTPNPYRGQS